MNGNMTVCMKFAEAPCNVLLQAGINHAYAMALRVLVVMALPAYRELSSAAH